VGWIQYRREIHRENRINLTVRQSFNPCKACEAGSCKLHHFNSASISSTVGKLDFHSSGIEMDNLQIAAPTKVAVVEQRKIIGPKFG